jgi:hypothetical protein
MLVLQTLLVACCSTTGTCREPDVEQASATILGVSRR